MQETDNRKCYIIDRDKLHIDYPTQFHDRLFWEELGRTIATFGFIEEMLGKAIFVLTGSQKFDPDGYPEAFNKWIKTLEKALTDQLGGLINSYEKALADNQRTKGIDHSVRLAELKKAKEIRNVLCHGSWYKPDDQGRAVPKFVNRELMVFETPVDVPFLKQTRAALKDIACDILDSVTSVGYQFTRSGSSGEQIWANPEEIIDLLES